MDWKVNRKVRDLVGSERVTAEFVLVLIVFFMLLKGFSEI
jgi:hypothetical protein